MAIFRIIKVFIHIKNFTTLNHKDSFLMAIEIVKEQRREKVNKI